MEDLDELLTTAEYARERKSSERTIERERTSSLSDWCSQKYLTWKCSFDQAACRRLSRLQL
jgi:hypothetical protein